MKTVVGLYSSLAEAHKVKAALQTAGYEPAHIKVIDQAVEGHAGAAGQDQPLTEKIKNFFTGFADHTDEHSHYANRVGSGGALLALTVPDNEAEEAAELLYEHGATGIEDDYTSTRTTDRTSFTGNNNDYRTSPSVSGEQVIPVVQEDLVVSKRQVNRGGVRVYSHVVETPVTEKVSLHDERIVVERRPVDRAAVDSDFTTGTGTIEVTAMGEEAVVGKTSRVVEEVRVGKQVSDRTEQVQDTVRRTEVDVEPTTVDTRKR